MEGSSDLEAHITLHEGEVEDDDDEDDILVVTLSPGTPHSRVPPQHHIQIPNARRLRIEALFLYSIVFIAWIVVGALLISINGSEEYTEEPLAPSETPSANTLIMISVDGLRHDYLELHGAPFMQTLSSEGFRVKKLKPVFISKTFPNHYTLVTGMYAESHGIVSNGMYDPKLGYFSYHNTSAVRDGDWWDDAEPLWVTAERQGIKSACYFWPGSEAEIRGYRPSIYKHYNTSITYQERVETILEWMALPEIERPRLILAYFETVDKMGHAYGPESEQVGQALQNVDNAISMLLSGINKQGNQNNVDILIMADHGMTSMQPQTEFIKLNQYIDLDRFQIIDTGVVASLRPLEPTSIEEAMKNLTNVHQKMTCWLKENIPKKFKYSNSDRIQPIFCLCDSGFAVIRGDGDSYNVRGSHGYDNEISDMYGAMLGKGPSLRKNYTREAVLDNIHVYGLVNKILGIVPHPNNGTWGAAQDLLDQKLFIF